MRRFIFGICVLILILTAAFFLSSGKESQKKVITPLLSPSAKPTQNTGNKLTRILFIPYWTMGESVIDVSNYDQTVYFGISANKDGIDKNEIGYKSLDNFMKITSPKKKRLLGVRLINSDINTLILRDKNIQKKVIEQSILLAKEKGFDGIVLDFEISALGFTSVTQNISNFEILYADTVKKSNLSFFATIYGDTFARFRPFDVTAIASHTDGIMIMAYDYHKANGNSGPNFPLRDNQEEGYDFQTMIRDFLQKTPPEKIIVVFGLFGYDWTVDTKGNSIGPAQALSYSKIEQKFLHACSFTDCKIVDDPISSETKVTYTDADSKSHIVWFEDIRSVAQKTSFLKSQGINAIAYWAYAYF